MTKKKLYLLLQAALLVLLAGLLIAAVVGICRGGLAEKAANPLVWIFTREKAQAVLSRLLPLMVLAAGTTLAGRILKLRDDDAENPAKDAAMFQGFSSLQKRAPRPKPGRGVRALRIAALCVALGLIVLGVFNGSVRDVLGKAVKICTECVGLG